MQLLQQVGMLPLREELTSCPATMQYSLQGVKTYHSPLSLTTVQHHALACVCQVGVVYGVHHASISIGVQP